MDRESFKPVTELSNRLFTWHGAITHLSHRHVDINWHDAGIGIKAEREEQANEEEGEMFLINYHSAFYSSLESYSNQGKADCDMLPFSIS